MTPQTAKLIDLYPLIRAGQFIEDQAKVFRALGLSGREISAWIISQRKEALELRR